MSKTKLKNVMVRGRMVWSNIYDKKVDEYNPKGKYILKLLVDMTDNQTVKTLVDAISEVGSTFGGGYATTFLAECSELNNLGAWSGNYLLTAKSDYKPDVINVTGQQEDNCYNGCYVYATIKLAPYTVGGKNGVTAYLGNVCKVADGENMEKRTAQTDFVNIIGKSVDTLLPNKEGVGIETTGEDVISDGNIPF